MNNEKGLSLIEVLIAIMVISIGLLGVANMQVVATDLASSSNKLTQATSMTQDKLEELMALPFADSDLADETSPGNVTAYTEPSPPPGYTITWEVDVNADGTKTVDVETTWSSSGDQKSFSLSFVKTP